MKGDFTRMTFRAEKHYTRVLKQQGRVDVDADWNEQNDILMHLDRTTRQDVIGPSGVPRDNDGFHIDTDPDGNLTFSPGRIYVDGILCEQHGTGNIRIDQQDDMAPGYNPPPPPGPYLVHLDVWERHVTHIQDPDIREAALGGPDTATRAQMVFQVKLHSIAFDEENQVPECQAFSIPPADGTLYAQTIPPDTSENPCVVGSEGGYTGLENRLYRVEIHDEGIDENGNATGLVTFKWSRDNGTVVLSVASDGFDGVNLTVLHTGKDHVLSVRPGDWVEVTNDIQDLSNQSGMLAQIEPDGVVHGAGLPRLVLSRNVSSMESSRAPVARRWDQKETDTVTLVEGAVPISNTWIDLEDGIQVRFDTTRTYHAGDYWLIPARTRKGTIEWPDNTVDVPAMGISHHYAELATAWFDGTQWRIRDCRDEFPPLVDVGSGGCCVSVRPGEDIQHALDQVTSAGGGCVVLCPGVHLLSAPLLIDNAHDVRLHGCGWSTILTTALQTLPELITIRNSERILIEDMLLTGLTTLALINLPQEGTNQEITISGCGLVHTAVIVRTSNTPAGIRITSTHAINIEKCRILAKVGIALPLGDTLPVIDDLSTISESAASVVSLGGYSDFGGLPIDAEYRVGDQAQINGMALHFTGYERGNGELYEGGTARVRGDESHSWLQTGNINAVFEPPEPVASASFNYRYSGGNVNVVVNSERLSASNPGQLDGQTVSGAAISVIPASENDFRQGRITITSASGMDRVGIGGQEFWIHGFDIGDNDLDEIPDADAFGLPSQVVRVAHSNIRFSRVGISAAIAEDLRVENSNIESIDRTIFFDIIQEMTDTLSRNRSLKARLDVTDLDPLIETLEEMFYQPAMYVRGVGILGCIIDGMDIQSTSIAAGYGIRSGILVDTVFDNCDLFGEKAGMVLLWPHNFACRNSAMFSLNGGGCMMAGGYAVKIEGCTIEAATSVAAIPSNVSRSAMAGIVSWAIRSLYASISAEQVRGFIWLIIEDMVERLELEEFFNAFDSWLHSVMPGIGITTSMLWALQVENLLRQTPVSAIGESKSAWPLSGLTIDGCTLRADNNCVQLAGLISLGEIAIRNNRLLSREGRALVCESAPYMQSPEFLQSVLVAFLGQAIHLFEDTIDDSEEGLFQSLAEALLPVLSEWHLSADDTFSTAVSISGNTIESYRTAIETNFFQASVTGNHITMRQRQEVRVELLARINGIVVLEGGLPIPGANVTIQGTGQGVTAGAHGTFVLADVPPGQVQLTATLAGLPAARPDPITIVAGEVREVTIVMNPSSFSFPYYGMAAYRSFAPETAYISAYPGNTKLQDTRMIERIAYELEQHELLTVLSEEIREGSSTEPDNLAAALDNAISDYAPEPRQELAAVLTRVASIADEETQTAANSVLADLSDNTTLKPALTDFVMALGKLSDSNGIVVRAPGCEIKHNFIGAEQTSSSARIARGGIDVSIDLKQLTLFLIISSILSKMVISGSTEGIFQNLMEILKNPMKLAELLPRTIISRNEIRGGSGHGITLIGSPLLPEFVYGLSIHGNEICDQSGCGIYNNTSAQLIDTSIQDNVIVRCGDGRGYTRIKGGICLDTCAGLTIRNNRVHSCGNDISTFPVFGINISAVILLVITGNSIVKNGASGEFDGGGMYLSSIGGPVQVNDNVCVNNNSYQVFWDGNIGKNKSAVNDTLTMLYSETASEISMVGAQFSSNQLSPGESLIQPTAILHYLSHLTINANTSNYGNAHVPGFDISNIGHLVVSSNQMTGASNPAMQISNVIRGLITGNLSIGPIDVDIMTNFIRSANFPPVI